MVLIQQWYLCIPMPKGNRLIYHIKQELEAEWPLSYNWRSAAFALPPHQGSWQFSLSHWSNMPMARHLQTFYLLSSLVLFHILFSLLQFSLSSTPAFLLSKLEDFERLGHQGVGWTGRKALLSDWLLQGEVWKRSSLRDQNRILSEYMGEGNDMEVIFPPRKSTM